MINTEFMRNNILTFGLELVSEKAILELLDHLEAVESECLEQARLNGMGSEREAALMAKLEAAEKDIAVKEEVIDSLAAVVKRLDAQCDAAERERDARLRIMNIAKAVENSINGIPNTSEWADGYIQAVKDIADGIRARVESDTICPNHIHAAKGEESEDAA